MSKKRPPAQKKSRAKAFAVSSRSWRAWLWRLALVLLVAFIAWAVWLDAQVRARFDGHKWTLPAKVYASPLSLYVGRSLSLEQLRASLEWTDYRLTAHATSPGTFALRAEQIQIYRRAFSFWDGAEPAQRITVALSDNKVSHVAVNGKAAALVRLEPQYIGGIFPAQQEDRELVRLEDFPQDLLAALIVTEDKHFLTHKGVSVRAVARAFWANWQARSVVQGGSTLTQQLVKNFFLTSERSLVRKANEAMMAVLLELHYSKQDILQTYLNEVYLGQGGRRAIHGFGLAARFYFAKPLHELNHAEMATLVGLVKGASYYNPRRHPVRAKARRDLVLGLMADSGIITATERLKAQSMPLRVADADRAGQREYPAFLDLVRSQLKRDYRTEDLQNEGLRVFTTLDPWLQHALEQATVQQLEALEAQNPSQRGKLQSAAVMTGVDGGEVRALLGGREAEYFGFNRALDAKRAIGSLAKPVVYLTALESGIWHWGTPIDDSPVTVKGEDGRLWQPQNFDRKAHGVVPMVEALALSYNQATARLGMQVGLEQIAAGFQRLGLIEKVPPYPSVLLGALSLSPYQVAGLYQGVAASGFVMPLRAIEGVTDPHGQTLSAYGIKGKQEFAPAQMQWLQWGLTQVVEQGTAKGLQFLPQPIAAKTGTSNDQRDAWFMGFDDRYLGVVWVGRDDNEPMPWVGGSAALPIWAQTFARIGVEPLPPSKALRFASVDNQGKVQGEHCEGRSYPFIAANLPAQLEDCHFGELNKKVKSWFDWLL